MNRQRIPLDRLLWGDECGCRADQYARMTGDLLRPSRTIEQWPHVKLLKRYREIGDDLLKPEVFFETDYGKNCLLALDLTGAFFSAVTPEAVLKTAGSFIDHFNNTPNETGKLKGGHSAPNSLVLVRPVCFSSYYQVIDGHHRVAIAWARGKKEVLAEVHSPSILTPIQSLLLDVLWERGRHELYQPIDLPELKESWVLVRRCEDRLKKIQSFLTSNDILPPAYSRYIDLGSNYGWFVKKMTELHFSAYGVERDPTARFIGSQVYSVPLERIYRSDLVRFLRETNETYDIVSCFSVLHHFVLGKNSVDGLKLIKLIDQITKKVLFLDTGQNHEEWFKDSLSQWDADYIENWLNKHASFSRIVRLGPDEDARPPYEKNFSRMLFACLK